MIGPNYTNMSNFQPLEVVDCGNETQSQVVENLTPSLPYMTDISVVIRHVK